jgi:hypothetical protein
MKLIGTRAAIAAAILSAGLAVPAVAQNNFHSWTDAQKEEFLHQGEVVRSAGIKIGVTGSTRLTLRHNGVEHDVHFQSVNVRQPAARAHAGLRIEFADSDKFNIAGYRLNRLLNLQPVPSFHRAHP